SQPAAEAARRIVFEGTHPGGQLEQDVLRGVLGVGFLEVVAAAPVIDPRPVAVYELLPGRLVGGLPAQPVEQGAAGGCGGCVPAHNPEITPQGSNSYPGNWIFSEASRQGV